MQNKTLSGILLAIVATLIWSGNFIIARGASNMVPPVMLALLRWACASLIMLPIAFRTFRNEWQIVKANWKNILLSAIAGVSVFNTLVYVAGHYTAAINLALIGTTSSPVFSFILARIFLKEKIPPLRLLGLLVCISGILLLLSRGSWEVLSHLRFTQGDWWILGAAFSFALYNIAARKKDKNIAPINYLFTTFTLGTLLLIPFAAIEYAHAATWHWTPTLAGIVLYLGAGTSVLAFFFWNISITSLGAARASIFGNLIPIFSSIEAVLILGEKISWIHYASMTIVLVGLVIANLQRQQPVVEIKRN